MQQQASLAEQHDGAGQQVRDFARLAQLGKEGSRGAANTHELVLEDARYQVDDLTTVEDDNDADLYLRP